jgi:cellulose synthase/poly-beta-1,6-N-acetylglucosamine synthase-like glycosyltransferase
VTVAIACLFLLALSVAVYAAGLIALASLRRDRRGARLPGFFPPVSIVKPLSGLDDDLERNLESFYRLDYPAYEVVFSFARRSDSAFSVARRVADRHPEVSSVFVVDAREPGGNSKVNRLAAALRHARFRYILMADGNVRVHPEFLGRAISFFADPSVGLVSHLFRARGARTLASRLESLHLNGVLRAGTAAMVRILGMPCVVGKSILVSREALNAIGGIEALRDHLAEDYLLGRMIAGAGYRVVLSGDEVEAAEVSRSLAGRSSANDWEASPTRRSFWQARCPGMREFSSSAAGRPGSWPAPRRSTCCAWRWRPSRPRGPAALPPRTACSRRFAISRSRRSSGQACSGLARPGGGRLSWSGRTP